MIGTYLNGKEIIASCGSRAVFKDGTSIDTICIPASAFKTAKRLKRTPKKTVKVTVLPTAETKPVTPVKVVTEVPVKKESSDADFAKHMAFSGVNKIS